MDETRDVQSDTRVLPNGAIQSVITGRIIANPNGGNKAITPANASVMSKKRWEAYREASENAIMDATRRNSPIDAWERIVSRQATLSLDIEKGRDSTNAAKFVQSALGLTENADKPQNEGVTVTLSGEIAAKLLDILSGNV